MLARANLTLNDQRKMNVWHPAESGQTLGKKGSEDGIIVLDEEHDRGARITLERKATSAPWAITCGVCGLMVHTAFASSEEAAQRKYRAMRSDVETILAEEEETAIIAQVETFVCKH